MTGSRHHGPAVSTNFQRGYLWRTFTAQPCRAHRTTQASVIAEKGYPGLHPA